MSLPPIHKPFRRSTYTCILNRKVLILLGKFESQRHWKCSLVSILRIGEKKNQKMRERPTVPSGPIGSVLTWELCPCLDRHGHSTVGRWPHHRGSRTMHNCLHAPLS